jgi:hypothetical protein
MARDDHKEERTNKTTTTTPPRRHNKGVIHTHHPTMKWTTTHRPHLLISPCIRQSKIYKACRLALRLRPSWTTKVIARHVTDHLFHIVLQWLSKCRAFDSNLEFFVQQKVMMNCFCLHPPSTILPHHIGLTLSYSWGSKKFCESVHYQFQIQIQKKQATQYTQPPYDAYPIKWDDIPMPMPIEEAVAAGGSSPRTTTPTTPTTTISPNHTCLICTFFEYQHPSPLCQWSTTSSFRWDQGSLPHSLPKYV